KPVHDLLPATISIAMVMGSLGGALEQRMYALWCIGGISIAMPVFAYFALRNKLSAWRWAFPFMALTFALFAFMNNLPEKLPQPVTSRTGTTFWKIADDHGVRCRVIGAPVNW